MSMLYALKPQKDRALAPVARALLSAGVTPNTVSAAGLLVSVAAGLVALAGNLHAGIVLFLFGACLDALDGSLARCGGRCTGFGRYFDSACDRLSELAFVAGAVAGGAPAAAAAVVGGSMLLMASRIYNHRKGRSSDAATFGRPERLALLIAGLLAPAPYGTALFLLAALLCLVSTVQVLASGFGWKPPRNMPAADARK
ncbi:MAG: Bifunctional IPC transferase and DIPP synthase [Methanocella sp. PtaU1.Bin125]|nr:MAG: Bifunctional IPC transferase and DIPP synthase [Methanocella sp. PtaU1.Bin125]